MLGTTASVRDNISSRSSTGRPYPFAVETMMSLVVLSAFESITKRKTLDGISSPKNSDRSILVQLIRENTSLLSSTFWRKCSTQSSTPHQDKVRFENFCA
jgi:hypothetical protein